MLHGGELNLHILRVLHNLGIMPRVDHHCDDPLSVLQPRASQDKVLIVQVDELLVAKLVHGGANWAEGALESVE